MGYYHSPEARPPSGNTKAEPLVPSKLKIFWTEFTEEMYVSILHLLPLEVGIKKPAKITETESHHVEL